MERTITLSTAFYIFSVSKYPKETYVSWFQTFLDFVRHNPYVYLMVYCDEESRKLLPELVNSIPHVRVAELPLCSFAMHRYRDRWIQNHEKNHHINQKTCWEINMLWSEKAEFVKRTAEGGFFPETEFHGWADAGYFRTPETAQPLYQTWARPERMFQLDKTKIHYAIVTFRCFENLKKLVALRKRKTKFIGIPPEQCSVGGGFFVLAREKVGEWTSMYRLKLEEYFRNDAVVKDDQIVIVDCALSFPSHFALFHEKPIPGFDPWFPFRRFLL